MDTGSVKNGFDNHGQAKGVDTIALAARCMAVQLPSTPSTPVLLALIAVRKQGLDRLIYSSAVISLPDFPLLFEESEPVLRGSAHLRSACL